MKLNHVSPSEIKRLLSGVREKENGVLKAFLIAGACLAFAVLVAGTVWYFLKRKEEEEFFDDEDCDDCCEDHIYSFNNKDRRIAKLEQKIRRHEEKAMHLREQLDAVTAFDEDDEEIEEPEEI